MAESNKGQFCTQDEQVIATLGNGYVADFLPCSGEERPGATLTNKRIYFSGKSYMFDQRGQLTPIRSREIIDVRDVTGVGFKQFEPVQYLIGAAVAVFLGILFTALSAQPVPLASTSTWVITGFGFWSIGMGALFCAVLLITYFSNRKTLFVIHYTGGTLAIEASILRSEEQNTFMHGIHAAKGAQD